MKIELKHIIGYYPYELRGVSKEENMGIETVIGISICGTLTPIITLVTDIDEIDLELFKPILHPLSDLTKEIEVNGEKIIPLTILLKNSCFDTKKMTWKEQLEFLECYKNIDLLTWNDFQKLFEWHFDVFGLIEKNLAIDINTLND